MASTDPTPAQPTAITAEDLPDDVGTLQRLVLELLASLQEERRDKESMRHRIEQLLRRLYGPRGERVDPNQLLLFVESMGEQDTAAEPPPTPAKPRRRCRPHGRRRLPDNLPREPRHHELSEAERICQGCGGLRVDIGSDRSEQLDYQPASLLVIEHFVHKYVCPCCSKQTTQSPRQPAAPSQESPPMPAEQSQLPPPEPASASGQTTSRTEQHAAAADAGDPGQPPQGPSQPEPPRVVLTAARPAMPIAKGLPGPGLLAHLIVSKYTDYLPLYRLQRIYERQGLFLHRSTLSDWLGACADLLRPLYDRMVLVALQSRALHTDDTTVKLQDPETHHLSTARLWAYLGDVAHPYNVFDFTRNRKRDGPQRFLANYQGYLHADAFTACICPTRAKRRRASSRWPATRTRGVSFTRRVAQTLCGRTRRWPITASSTSWNGVPRTLATRNVCKCVRSCRCQSWRSFISGWRRSVRRCCPRVPWRWHWVTR